jgi:hypothetical protein
MHVLVLPVLLCLTQASNTTISESGATLVFVEEESQLTFAFDDALNLAIVLLPQTTLPANITITDVNDPNCTWDAPSALAFGVLDGTRILIGSDVTGIATIWILPKSLCPGPLHHIVTFQYVIGNWVFEEPHGEPICFFPENPPSEGGLTLTALYGEDLRATFYDGNFTIQRPITAPDSLKKELEGEPFFFRLDTITSGSQFGYVIEYSNWLTHEVCEDDGIPLMDDTGFVVRPPDGDATVGLACSNESAVRLFVILFIVIVGIVGLGILVAITYGVWRCCRKTKK